MLPFRHVTRLLFLVLVLPVILPLSTTAQSDASFRVLIFSKTDGFRHASIEPAIEAVQKMGEEYGFEVDATEDSQWFTHNRLEAYDVVFFLNTSMTLFNDEQRAVFESYIRSGGGYLGTHSAADTEYEWPFYGKLVGAWFKNHPPVQQGNVEVQRFDHPSTALLPAVWTIEDEWYNFRELPTGVTVLAELDTRSIEGSEHPGYHPATWYHHVDAGRAFYTVMGHSSDSWEHPYFLKQLLGGLRFVAGITDTP